MWTIGSTHHHTATTRKARDVAIVWLGVLRWLKSSLTSWFLASVISREAAPHA
jgi:hypothetical protein